MSEILFNSLVKPNFMCIGSQKGGTSWLYEMLKQHPDIWLPDIKEIHYFDYQFGEKTNTKKWGPGHIKRAMERLMNTAKTSEDKQYVQNMISQDYFTLDWYYSIFKHPYAIDKKIIGEVTPEYCSISEQGILAIKGMLGEGKIIWMVRDPYERALSQIKMSANRMLDNVPKSEKEWNLFLGKISYLNRANYSKYIPLWDRHFGNNIKYIPYGMIKRDPHSLLIDIENFLEVDEFKYTGAQEVVHKTKGVQIPEWLKNRVKSETDIQFEFLSRRFDNFFMEKLK